MTKEKTMTWDKKLYYENSILLSDIEYIKSNFGKNDAFRNSTILITGYAGFLGFNFLTFFSLSMDYYGIKRIIALDNYLLGTNQWVTELRHLHKDIDIVNFDIGKSDISLIPHANEADFIIHLASIASPTFYRKYPIETIDGNIWGLRTLLEFYKDKSLKSFLFFSSSEIYGDPFLEFIPTAEDYSGNVACIGPRACYDESKRFGETLCYVFAQQFSMPIQVARPFNNFGPGMKLTDKRIPADFAQAVMNKQELVLFSDGSPRRTFCYVADALVGYLKMMTWGKYEYFNIGIDKPEISVNELARIYQEKIHKLFGYDCKIRHQTSEDSHYLTDNPQRRCPDITKAMKLLNYRPTIEVADGVERFILFLKEEERGSRKW